MRTSKLKTSVKKAIAKKAMILGYKFDNALRVQIPEENLIDRTLNWNEIRKEIGKGQGSELKSKNGQRPKFCSVYSSTCLCVNNFALMKSLPGKATVLGFPECYLLRFEEKVNTGISSPNLDVYLESERGIFGIESKFTEILEPKLPNWKTSKSIGNLTNYINRRAKIRSFPQGFAENVIKYYEDKKEKQYLDVAQLIKHTLGILARSHSLDKKYACLCYMYWLPHNAEQYPQFLKHNEEIKEFRALIEPYIEFKDMSYSTFWDLLECDNDYALLIQQLRKRYDVIV